MGLTLSLYVVYLHNVRGFSTGFSTLLLSISAIAGLASSPLWGTATDRFGPVRLVLVAYVLDAGALVLFAFVHTKTQAVIAALALAIFGGAGWGPSSTLLSRLIPEEHRQRAFGFNFMLVNLGIGFGGLVSAFIVNTHRPMTFTMLYVFNAGVTLVAAGFMFTLRRHGRPIKEHRDDPVKSAEGWGVVLRDKRLVQIVIAMLVLMIGGYGSLDAGFSLFVVNDLKLSVHSIGVMFFFNTSTIVLAQLWVLNHIHGAMVRFLDHPRRDPGGAEVCRRRVAVLCHGGLCDRRDDALAGRSGSRERHRPRAPARTLQRRPGTHLGRLGIGGARDHRALFRSRTGELVAVQYGRDRAVRRPVDVEPSSTPERPRRRSRARDQPDLVPRE